MSLRSIRATIVGQQHARHRTGDAERAAHGALIATLGAKAIWNEYPQEAAKAASV
jgi:hypothetical protein